MKSFNEILVENKNYKVGDIVYPLSGPMKGWKHKIIHIFDNGEVNIKPEVSINKYRHGALTIKIKDIKPWPANNKKNYIYDLMDDKFKEFLKLTGEK